MTRAVLTVSDLTARLREVIEDRFPALWVEGEISNFRLYASGHCYFTLKDGNAQVRCVFFRSKAQFVDFALHLDNTEGPVHSVLLAAPHPSAMFAGADVTALRSCDARLYFSSCGRQAANWYRTAPDLELMIILHGVLDT